MISRTKSTLIFIFLISVVASFFSQQSSINVIIREYPETLDTPLVAVKNGHQMDWEDIPRKEYKRSHWYHEDPWHALKPINLHKNYDTSTCGSEANASLIHPAAYPLFHMVFGYKSDKKRHYAGHQVYSGPMEVGVQIVQQLQTCSYKNLEKWWELADQYNISNWSAHGGTLMGAYCHRSINPWDDDIDITVGSCKPLQKIYAEATPVNETYPEMKTEKHSNPGLHWHGRLLEDKGWILIQGRNPGMRWFKLKSVAQALSEEFETHENNDLGGMDIMCFNKMISMNERRPMNRSGYQETLVEQKPLQIVEYGPTWIKIPNDTVILSYIRRRYHSANFCDFPFDRSKVVGRAPSFRSNAAKKRTIAARAAQQEVAVSKWYIPQSERDEWLEQMDAKKGSELKKEIPNLNHVEIDNRIADNSSCTVSAGETMKVVEWNANRGTYWAEFVEMTRKDPSLKDADLIILNEVDIGMARSGNVHTARRLAFELGMNYAWGLEFVELTNGNQKEQNMTNGMTNSMGLHGNAILSKCKIYNPLIVRDPLPDANFTETSNKTDAKGSEKRVGGRMGMFVRIGETEGQGSYIIAGSIHKLHEKRHRATLREYMDISFNATRQEAPDARPSDLLGIVVAGDNDKGICQEAGLFNIDTPREAKALPGDCGRNYNGSFPVDLFCGNMVKIANEGKSIPPCYVAPNTNILILVSDHGILRIDLKLWTNNKVERVDN